MMTCKNCLYFNMCYVLADNPEEAEVEGAETDCSSFADRSRYVVREKGEWQYTEDIDEDGNIQAYCSACGAGDKHASSMVGKVPYCWNCGADMRKGENKNAAD